MPYGERIASHRLLDCTADLIRTRFLACPCAQRVGRSFGCTPWTNARADGSRCRSRADQGRFPGSQPTRHDGAGLPRYWLHPVDRHRYPQSQIVPHHRTSPTLCSATRSCTKSKRWSWRSPRPCPNANGPDIKLKFSNSWTEPRWRCRILVKWEYPAPDGSEQRLCECLAGLRVWRSAGHPRRNPLG
jgi:hypothetical protein